MSDPVEIVAQTLYDEAGVEYPEDPQVSRCVLSALHKAGWRIVRPAERDDHFVAFDAEGWQIEHSAECRNAGQMLSGCVVHRELTAWCPGAPIHGEGRYRVVTVDVLPVFNGKPSSRVFAHTFGLRKVSDDEPKPEALLFTDEWTPEKTS